MLIIPMTGKMSWRNPPVLTLFLILLNCLVYFVVQAGDEESYLRAQKYYVDSGLAEIETSRYLEYLKTAGREPELPFPAKKGAKDEVTLTALHYSMQSDDVFMKSLLNDQVISPGDANYAHWKELRKKYAELRSTITSERYGYKPAGGSLFTAFTSLFLHGGLMHLVGNMIFLWLVGCTLELAGNRWVYALEYLITGLCATLFFGLVYHGSTTPLIGASGAIAGIIGAFTVVYGRQRIKIFYSLGFYFNYAKVPAIALLPVWIGNEIVQLLFGGVTNVAYVAHLGGLVSGAALGLAQRKWLGGAKEEALEDDRAERIALLLEKGLQQLSQLKLAGARDLMEEVLALDPQNLKALTQLFNIDKLIPGQEKLHETASRLFLRLQQEGHSDEALFTTYQDYCRIAKPPRLSPELWTRLCLAFANQGHLEDSAKITALLLRGHPQFQGVAPALLNLGRAYFKAGMSKKGDQCLRLLIQKYPAAAESQMAAQMLKGAG
jgi:membrane associated rhomboid family serine protease